MDHDGTYMTEQSRQEALALLIGAFSVKLARDNRGIRSIAILADEEESLCWMINFKHSHERVLFPIPSEDFMIHILEDGDLTLEGIIDQDRSIDRIYQEVYKSVNDAEDMLMEDVDD